MFRQCLEWYDEGTREDTGCFSLCYRRQYQLPVGCLSPREATATSEETITKSISTSELSFASSPHCRLMPWTWPERPNLAVTVVETSRTRICFKLRVLQLWGADGVKRFG